MLSSCRHVYIFIIMVWKVFSVMWPQDASSCRTLSTRHVWWDQTGSDDFTDPTVWLKTESVNSSGCQIFFVGSLSRTSNKLLTSSVIFCCVQGLSNRLGYTVLKILYHCCFIFQTDADPEVCKRMCKDNHYENVLSQVSYYQMVRQYNTILFWINWTWQQLIVAIMWPCRSIVWLCGCCCSKCSGRCAAWTLLSSPPSSTPSSPWSWPGTCRLTHRVKTFYFLCLLLLFISEPLEQPSRGAENTDILNVN